MDTIIFVDTETGGTNPERHSLLSVGLVAWNYNEGVIATKEIFIKHKSYSITREAQHINKFNQAKHNELAVTPKTAVDEIKSFAITCSKKEKDIQLAGHNIQFDVAFLKRLFGDQHRSFSKVFSHRMIDTYSILRFLDDAGKIRIQQLSSSSAFHYYGIKAKKRHSALGDALATVELYEKLLKNEQEN